MAQVVTGKFEFRKTRGIYAWEQWLDGQAWKLTRGEDFKVEPTTFRLSVYQAAKRYGVKVHTSVQGKDLVVQAIRRKKAA